MLAVVELWCEINKAVFCIDYGGGYLKMSINMTSYCNYVPAAMNF